MEITVYGPLRAATGSKTVGLEFAGDTVADAIDAFADAYPRAEQYLYDDRGAIRASVRVTVDGERAELEAPISDDASLALMPAVQGGSREGERTGERACERSARSRV
ncbi:ubiquitin-like small modifier protein 1 [Natronolimnohabitans innermongolicus]|uniref:Sulfur carrier protein ThiS n=1 Tax=Natronolimnohabitans innermongolicus JCM 12255 TaxID=1227499 RepID=L9XA50_9EURY|nr:ubiquitin-like small modifier protein 1 [Natronolimnohabitans innermongolicus]ELY58634.1 sulfur carrier protein ThiS [Natronolimnohabitans innermongolicus JCM 12255]